jgi:hypothetical protein
LATDLAAQVRVDLRAMGIAEVTGQEVTGPPSRPAIQNLRAAPPLDANQPAPVPVAASLHACVVCGVIHG